MKKIQILIKKTEIRKKPNQALIWEYIPQFLGEFRSKKNLVSISISQDELDAMADMAQVLDLSLLCDHHSLDSLVIVERKRV